MASTYEVINAQTLSSATADVYFTSISQTYTDLVLVISGTSAATTNAAWRVNSDNTNKYSTSCLYVTNTSPGTTRNQDNFGRFDNWGAVSTTGMYSCVAQFMNYSNTSTYKTVVNRSGNGSGVYPGSSLFVGVWHSTSAITSINVLSQSGANFAVGSTFTLYGIKAA